jgi:hypothetical protein
MQTTIAGVALICAVAVAGAAVAANGGGKIPHTRNAALNKLVEKAVAEIGGQPSLSRKKRSFRVTGGSGSMQAKQTLFTNKHAAQKAYQKLASEKVEYLPNIETLKAPTRTFYQVTVGDAGGIANFHTKAEADAAVEKVKTIAYSMHLYTHEYEPYTTEVEGGQDAWDEMDRSDRRRGAHGPSRGASNLRLYGNQ